MTAPIQPGDVVVCVDTRPKWIQRPPATTAFARLRLYGTYRVLRLGTNDLGKAGIDIGVPNTDLWPGFNNIWPPECFRKIRPADEQFTQHIHSLKPVRESA